VNSLLEGEIYLMVKRSGKMVMSIFDIEGQIIVGFVETEATHALGL
jgi:hypothetical protein